PFSILFPYTTLFRSGGTAYNVGFVTSAPFDEVQISLTSLLSAVNILNVYSPFVDMRTAVDANGNPLCPQISLAPDFNATFINVPDRKSTRLNSSHVK